MIRYSISTREQILANIVGNLPRVKDFIVLDGRNYIVDAVYFNIEMKLDMDGVEEDIVVIVKLTK